MYGRRNGHSRIRPTIERLESRECPAMVLGFDAGHRLTSVAEASQGQSDNVVMSVGADGQLTVTEGSTSYGTFNVARNLSVSLGHIASGPGYVNVLELDNHVLKTNLNVSLGDQGAAGPTQFRILGGRVGVAGEGTIKGDIHATAGEGSQFFVFGELGASVAHHTNVIGSVFVDMGPGGEAGPPDAVGTVGRPPNPATANISGNLEVHNSTIFVIAGRVGRNLTVDSPSKSADQLVVLGNFGRPMEVGRTATITTGSGNDSISLENAKIKRDLTISSGGGDDYVELANSDLANDPTNAAFQDAPAKVRGNVNIQLGEGNDIVDFGTNSEVTPGSTVRFTIGRSLSVDGGEGDDQLNFNDLEVRGPAISLLTGEGNDGVRLSRLDTSRAFLFALLGSGDDELEVADDSHLRLGVLLAAGEAGTNSLVPGNLGTYRFPQFLFGF